MNAVRLWSGGLAAAVVAALAGLVGVLVVRAVFRIALYAPRAAGVFGGSSTARLCVVAAVAALAATGVPQLESVAGGVHTAFLVAACLSVVAIGGALFVRTPASEVTPAAR